MDTAQTYRSLAPSLLVSMPQLHDPNFERSVILLCEHSEEAAFGLILNRPTERTASEVVRLVPLVSLTPAERRKTGLELWIGGPVEPERGWLLMGNEPNDSDVVRVCDGIFLSTSPQLLRKLLEGPPQPRTRFLTGYAGWGAGQLDAELAASAWLHADIDLDIVFDTQPTEMWEMTIRRMGADPSLLQMGGGTVH